MRPESMRYVSTRGAAPELGFADVLLAGLADDGGLYVPASWPALPGGLHGGMPYAEVAAAIMQIFVGDDIAPDAMAAMAADAYATFRHPAVCPLVQLDTNCWLAELSHGPTLAFKDVALQLVGRLFDHVLDARGQRLVIVGATSGDTGSAAIDGVQHCAHVDIVILYPQGRVSEVQRRQMTTVAAPNVHAVAVDGSFDDCQDLVKAMFADAAFRQRLGVPLSAVNSINWARIAAQVVYYVTSALALGGGPGQRPISFAVPTGNFGNVLAGWVARRMGLPIAQLIVGSNRNDILTRWLSTGAMRTSTVHPTLSPSMDIQVSSNVERLIFELNGRDGGVTAEQFRRFRTTGSMALEPDQHAELTALFAGGRVDDDATLATIADVYRRAGLLIDPHTAVGVAVGRASRARGAGRDDDSRTPLVCLSTAHPAKFPDAVEAATGHRPTLPDHLADLFDRPERTSVLADDLAAVEAFVEAAVAGATGR